MNEGDEDAMKAIEPEATPSLLRACLHQEGPLREAALSILREMGTEVIPFVERLLHDEMTEDSVREEATEVLERIQHDRWV